MKLPSIWVFLFLTLSDLVWTSENIFDPNHHLMGVWKLSTSNNKFGYDLLRDLSRKTPKNLIFCPTSIYITLGMLYFGARGGTAKELERVLGYEPMNLTRPEVTKGFRYLMRNQLVTSDPSNYVLDVANAIIVNEFVGLSSIYKNKVERYFKAQIVLADFGKEQDVLDYINGWVRNKTGGKIRGIINYLDDSMDVIALNAAYFKSKWVAPFPEENTQDGYFFNAGKHRKLVTMMEQRGMRMMYKDDKVRVLHLPFRGRNISMLFILPHKKDQLLAVEKSFSPVTLIQYLNGLAPKYIRITIPKFNFTFAENLVPNLNRLGAKKMFQTSLANFSAMVPNSEVAIGEVRHKAIIEVNEAGVEASGATATLTFKSMDVTEYDDEFFADHPFAYFILDERSDMILFMGHVWNF